MYTSKPSTILFALTAAVVLLVGCYGGGDPVRHDPARFDSDLGDPGVFAEQFLPILDDLTEDHALAMSADGSAKNATIALGGSYRARVWRPGFVESWVILMDPPDCAGKGLGFAKCVKKHLDDGEVCTVSKSGDAYEAHCKMPSDDEQPSVG